MRALRVSSDAGRVELVLALEPGDPSRTSQAPGLAESVRRVLPGIDRHRCTSPGTGLLASEIADTEIAHLVEHVALEFAVLAGSPRTLGGNTDWDFARDGRGVFRITLETDCDALGEAAAREAVALVGRLLDGSPAGDVAAVTRSLAELRGGGG